MRDKSRTFFWKLRDFLSETAGIRRVDAVLGIWPLFDSGSWVTRFSGFLANFYDDIKSLTETTSGRVFLTEMVKRHIYGPIPFIWAYNQVSMTFRSKVLARTRKRWQEDRKTDGRTDGHPKSIGPQLLGWGLILMTSTLIYEFPWLKFGYGAPWQVPALCWLSIRWRYFNFIKLILLTDEHWRKHLNVSQVYVIHKHIPNVFYSATTIICESYFERTTSCTKTPKDTSKTFSPNYSHFRFHKRAHLII